MSDLVNGVVLSSNPIRIKGEVLDLRGQQYGELTVIDFSKKDKQGRAIWKCLCSCGVTKDIRAQSLRSGAVISCGHIARQKSAKRMSCLNRTKDGASREDWYSNYNSMCHRILHGTQEDKKYYNSARINGVLLEPAWIDDPWMFYDEIGSKPGSDYTIDRIDSHKGYIPGNVRWANKHTQSVNQDRKPQGQSGYVGIQIYEKGVNRRSRDRYLAFISVNGKKINLGTYLHLENAMRVRYDAEEKYGYHHTFKRPKGELVSEPDYTFGEHPGITYDKERKSWRATFSYDANPRKHKYLGSYDTLETAQQALNNATQMYKAGNRRFLNDRQRSRDGIIAISPEGKEYEFDSIADFHRQMNCKINLNRILKNGGNVTSKKSKFYQWCFKRKQLYNIDEGLLVA
ncbi:hypothetical protein DKZ34_09605 [Limosilactobacillus reuteri]|uniref:hypothetical protein n=1 Tax=Limosilactobacillus reuteri TaxID=1598 RepID=UPI000D6ECAA1|nr:hypothetical protein [Limosilactobacillus reuteri]PWT39195.1 hypothetical protein DKZ34_09605 [Limosilactobacillus reuteri]